MRRKWWKKEEEDEEKRRHVVLRSSHLCISLSLATPFLRSCYGRSLANLPAKSPPLESFSSTPLSHFPSPLPLLLPPRISSRSRRQLDLQSNRESREDLTSRSSARTVDRGFEVCLAVTSGYGFTKLPGICFPTEETAKAALNITRSEIRLISIFFFFFFVFPSILITPRL